MVFGDIKQLLIFFSIITVYFLRKGLTMLPSVALSLSYPSPSVPLTGIRDMHYYAWLYHDCGLKLWEKNTESDNHSKIL